MSNSSAKPNAPGGKWKLKVDTENLSADVPGRQVRLKTDDGEFTPAGELISGPDDSATWSSAMGESSKSAAFIPQEYSTNLTEKEANYWRVEGHLVPHATRRSRALVIVATVARHGQKPPTAEMLEEEGYNGSDLDLAASVAREMVMLRSHRIGFTSSNLPCPPEFSEKAKEMYLRRHRNGLGSTQTFLDMERAAACREFVEALDDLYDTNFWIKTVSEALKARSGT